jgi:adenine-specific DNA-methyltransferase
MPLNGALNFLKYLDNEGKYLGFDVVIGNPPYVNFANLNEELREYYKKFILYKNKTDLYAFFVGLSEKIKSNNGLITLIIPHTWISTTSFLPLRNLLLNKSNLNTIVEFDFGVFKDAYVKTVVIHIENDYNNNLSLLNDKFDLIVNIPKNIIKEDNELKINLSWNPTKHKIFLKIKKDSKNLGEILHFSRGIKTSNDSRFLFKEKKNNEYFKVIRGRNIKAVLRGRDVTTITTSMIYGTDLMG